MVESSSGDDRVTFKESIPENGTGQLDDIKIAVANGCQDDFRLADGGRSFGPTMLIVFLEDGRDDLRVGEGSEIDINGQVWRVTSLRPGHGGTGEIQFETERYTGGIPEPAPMALDFIFSGFPGMLSSSCTVPGCARKEGWSGDYKLDEKHGPGVHMVCPQHGGSWSYGGGLHRLFRDGGMPEYEPGRSGFSPDYAAMGPISGYVQYARKENIQLAQAPSYRWENDLFSGGLWIYNLFLLLGFSLLVYIFGFAFDDLSEDELVQLTVAWYIPIVFGIYGRTATKIMRWMQQGWTLQDSFQKVGRLFAVGVMLRMLFFFPFCVLSRGSPLKVAITGSLAWAGLLALFFFGVWPVL